MSEPTSENERLAAAWDAGFDAAALKAIQTILDAQVRGVKAASASIKPVANPYRTTESRAT